MADSARAGTYLVMCRFDASQRSEMLARRADHLEFAVAHRGRIRYGGLLTGPDGPEGISYAIAAGSPGEAAEWLASDPYRSVYSSVEITSFVQRIPEAFEGELEQLLRTEREAPS